MSTTGFVAYEPAAIDAAAAQPATAEDPARMAAVVRELVMRHAAADEAKGLVLPGSGEREGESLLPFRRAGFLDPLGWGFEGDEPGSRWIGLEGFSDGNNSISNRNSRTNDRSTNPIAADPMTRRHESPARPTPALPPAANHARPADLPPAAPFLARFAELLRHPEVAALWKSARSHAPDPRGLPGRAGGGTVQGVRGRAGGTSRPRPVDRSGRRRGRRTRPAVGPVDGRRAGPARAAASFRRRGRRRYAARAARIPHRGVGRVSVDRRELYRRPGRQRLRGRATVRHARLAPDPPRRLRRSPPALPALPGPHRRPPPDRKLARPCSPPPSAKPRRGGSSARRKCRRSRKAKLTAKTPRTPRGLGLGSRFPVPRSFGSSNSPRDDRFGTM